MMRMKQNRDGVYEAEEILASKEMQNALSGLERIANQKSFNLNKLLVRLGMVVVPVSMYLAHQNGDERMLLMITLSIPAYLYLAYLESKPSQ